MGKPEWEKSLSVTPGRNLIKAPGVLLKILRIKIAIVEMMPSRKA